MRREAVIQARRNAVSVRAENAVSVRAENPVGGGIRSTKQFGGLV